MSARVCESVGIPVSPTSFVKASKVEKLRVARYCHVLISVLTPYSRTRTIHGISSVQRGISNSQQQGKMLSNAKCLKNAHTHALTHSHTHTHGTPCRMAGSGNLRMQAVSTQVWRGPLVRPVGLLRGRDLTEDLHIRTTPRRGTAAERDARGGHSFLQLLHTNLHLLPELSLEPGAGRCRV